MIPDFLRARLAAQYGAGDVERILAGYTARRAVSLRVNLLKTTPAAVKEALTAAGIPYETVSWSEAALVLPASDGSDVRALPLYEKGEIYLQSLSSQLPPIVLAPRAGADILDMAAAPGGKTTEIAAMVGDRAFLTACEKDAVRAERLRYNLQKQGVSRVSVMVTDARKLDDHLAYDQILLDAPCSGSGTLSEQHPASFRAFSEALVRNSSVLQSALLTKALKILKKGGVMVYSTCSILADENEAVIERAIKAGAEVVPIAFDGMETLPLLPTRIPGTLCVCPTSRYEGFFVCSLRATGK